MSGLPQPQAVNLQIFATDIRPDAIARARRGRYPLAIAQDVSAQRLERYFEAHQTCLEVKKSIRDLVLFAQHDVVQIMGILYEKFCTPQTKKKGVK